MNTHALAPRTLPLLPLAMLFPLLAGPLLTACSGEDGACQVNADCKTGALCGPQSTCVPGEALEITTAELPAGLAGTAYSLGLSAKGGLLPYAWAATFTENGTVIPWMEISSKGSLQSQGLIPEEGARQIEIQVTLTDQSNGGAGASAQKTFNWRVDVCTGPVNLYQAENGACHSGYKNCVNGQLTDWVKLGASSDVNFCGATCSKCQETKAQQCLAGICKCGTTNSCVGSNQDILK